MTITRIRGPRRAEPLGPLDPREHAWREDLADIALADRIAVPNYVVPLIREATLQLPVLSADRADAPASSELLPGEPPGRIYSEVQLASVDSMIKAVN